MGKILVVEDDKYLNKLLCDRFVLEGFDVTSCQDGDFALKKLEEARVSAEENPKKRRRLNDQSGDSLDPDQLEVLYVRLITACSLPFRLVECSEFRAAAREGGGGATERWMGGGVVEPTRRR